MAIEEHNPLPPPEYDYRNYDPAKHDAAEAEYLEKLKAHFAQRRPNDTNIGKTYRSHVADGYAEYMVSQTEPFSVVHVPFGDAYRLPAPHVRGLILDDVLEQESSTARLKALTSG